MLFSFRTPTVSAFSSKTNTIRSIGRMRFKHRDNTVQKPLFCLLFLYINVNKQEYVHVPFGGISEGMSVVTPSHPH